MSIGVVILAAGEGSRFGSIKQLADWQGQPMLASVWKQVSSLSVESRVCLGAHRAEILKSVSIPDHQLIQVDAWREGPGASIKAAIQALNRDSKNSDAALEGVLFVLGDQPLVDSEFLIQFLSLCDKQIVCAQYSDGHLGVPAYFPQSSFDDLMKIDARFGAKRLLNESQVIAVLLDGRELDIDTPEDLARASSQALP